jgi:hypothetical protein
MKTAAFLALMVVTVLAGCRGSFGRDAGAGRGDAAPTGGTVAATLPARPAAGSAAATAAALEVDRDERWLVFDLTPAQRRAYDAQVEANRRGAGYKVTITFTPEQLAAIRAAFPGCRETSITWDERCIFEYRAALRFDAQDRIITPAPPYTSR